MSWSINQQFSSRKVFGSTFQDVAREFQDENCVRIGKGSGRFGYTITATALSNNMKGSDENRWTSCIRISDDTTYKPLQKV